MSAYYYLLNDSKSESVHLDDHIKHRPMTNNLALYFALCNYIMEHLGDTFRMCSDIADEGEDYNEVNLLRYRFRDSDVMVKIVELLNEVYKQEMYRVVDGVGVRAM